ncbi:hypothetical protein [Celeribacter baekdonensis]|nr:hypothetical protein [Celeribacter baekdonensis]
MGSSVFAKNLYLSAAAYAGGENRECDEMAEMSILNGSHGHPYKPRTNTKHVSLETRLFHRLDDEMAQADSAYSEVIDLLRVNRRVFDPAFLPRKMRYAATDTSGHHIVFDVLFGLRAHLGAIRNVVMPVRLLAASGRNGKGAI